MTSQWAPSRLVPLEGAVNVRDIGGYRTTHGLEVRRGRLFRGDALTQLSPADVKRLDQLGLRTVIDFRTSGEVLLSGTDRLPPGVEYVSLPVGGGDLGSLYELIASGDHDRQRRELGGGRAAWLMVEINRGFVADARQREAFGAAMRLMCSPGRLPLLYHCSGGKDRAGWMTAIVLTAVGVPRELVLRDYLLSNDFHRTGYQKLRLDLIKTGIVDDPELLRPIMEQSATYLSAAFDEADRAYPSFGVFLTHGLEVSKAMVGELRRELLGELAPPEPVPLYPAGTPGHALRRRGPRRLMANQVSSTKSTPSPIMTPMSFSHCMAVWSHSASGGLPWAWLNWLRLAVEATAPNPQRAGAIAVSPKYSDTGTPPDKMTWNMVSKTRTGIAFSDVLTRAETSRPRHIEASERTAMASSSSTRGVLLRKEPDSGSLWVPTPSRTRTIDCTRLMEPSTSSLEAR